MKGRKTYHYTNRLKEFMSTNNAEIMDLRDLRLSGYIYITSPVSMAQATFLKRRWKDCKSQNTRESVIKTVSARNGCINKTTEISVGMLT